MIYIQNANAITKKKEILSWLKEFGIKEEKINFSDCFVNTSILNKRKCECESWGELSKKDFLISFKTTHFVPNLKRIDFVRLFFNRKYRNNLNSAINDIYALGKTSGRTIIICVGKFLENNLNKKHIKSTLKHEILHLKDENYKEHHCRNKNCLFNCDLSSDLNKGHSFCKKHQKEFQEVIKILNDS